MQMLADELPPTAYLDRGFDTWLKRGNNDFCLDASLAQGAASRGVLRSGAGVRAGARPWHAEMVGDLTPKRQEALMPLAGEWNKIDELRKKKWLVVADKYAAMKPEEQKRLQARMADWAKLTPEQRNVARENYKSAKAVPPEQKKAEWQKYQSLPDAQKKQLAAAADAKKPVKQKAVRRQLATRGATPAPAPGKAPGRSHP